MKKILGIILILVLFQGLSTAATASYNFNISEDQETFNPGIIYENSLVLQITTTENVLCKYSETKGTHFISMEGTFDDNFETLHKKVLTDLPSGVHRYYVRCRDINDVNNNALGLKELEAAFTLSNKISARVLLDSSTLTEGKYEITVLTSKIPSKTPELTYSYDGIVYKPIIIYGSGTLWKGYLIIPSNFGEGIGSFKFSATDLEGRVGTEVIGENIFIVDTKRPLSITSISANGEFGQISINWFNEEESDSEKVNIYRSDSPGVDLTDLLTSLDSNRDSYTDSGVSLGKTYYYKLALEDSAKNLGDLSREISVTVRRDNISSGPEGLSENLIGSVDAVLTEASLIEDSIDFIRDNQDKKSNEEKEKENSIGVGVALSSASSELSAIKRDIQNLKLQDLNKDSLDSKLSQLSLRLNSLKKKIPETVILSEESSIEQTIDEDTIRESLVEYAIDLTPSEISKAVKKSLNLAKANGLKINSEISIYSITYLDGSRGDKTLIKHTLESTFEKLEDALLILKYSENLFEKSSLTLITTGAKENRDNLITFETDAKEIKYYLNKKLVIENLEEITISPYVLSEEGSVLTGYFLSEIPSKGSFGIGFLIILTLSLMGYLGYMRNSGSESSAESFLEKAKKVRGLQKSGQNEEATTMYDSLKGDYLGLSEKEKEKVFSEVKHLGQK